MNRCKWATNELLIKYHDEEWGVITNDDTKLFELIILEGAQSGLSWNTILQKREEYRNAFCDFDYNKLANVSDEELENILKTSNVVRNKLKVYSVRNNAIAFIKIRNEFKSFYNYIWSFTDFAVIDNKPNCPKDIPNASKLSMIVSKDLKRRGFKFVGPIIIYSYLQSIGVINDHLIDCGVRK
ncbi:MAG: DNA-3-methyladenine glycosylase I [Bacilli bacterium]